MKSLDTNVLARFFIDDADDLGALRQRPAAIQAISERCHVTVTVLLEFEWVMRGFYRLPTPQIAHVLRALLGLQHVSIEDRSAVLAALDCHAHGMDFADALHLARSSRCNGFVSFDKALARRAAKLDLNPPVQLLAD